MSFQVAMVRSLRSNRPITVEPVQTPGKLAAEEEAPSRVRREWVTPSYPTEEAHQMTDEEQSAKVQRLLTFWFDYGGRRGTGQCHPGVECLPRPGLKPI